MNEKKEFQQRTSRVNIRLMPNDEKKLRRIARQKGIAATTYCYLIIKDHLDQIIAE